MSGGSRDHLLQTPSQTVGPFFHFALTETPFDHLDPDGHAGDAIVVVGTVRDGAGDPIDDAMVEVWQADGGGRYRHPADGRVGDVSGSFVGFGRVATAQESGEYRFVTVMPGTVPGRVGPGDGPGRDGTVQAPHLNVQVFARGLLNHLHTRIYFAGAGANDADPVLATVPAERRATLLAEPDGHEDGRPRYRFDLVLQGEGETVFFDA
ncbi:MAG TPA: protocatechuate 3,4-dioxygenase subunit alpha [Egicoccus sp.]|nr:protocatechuate 3,4-dioxygenase subunit alpha [Egicoccus sp.]HSK25127.1 protocatechuate 3,4-dioxygenase subunit alpha [Egicoccus sp.]